MSSEIAYMQQEYKNFTVLHSGFVWTMYKLHYYFRHLSWYYITKARWWWNFFFRSLPWEVGFWM